VLRHKLHQLPLLILTAARRSPLLLLLLLLHACLTLPGSICCSSLFGIFIGRKRTQIQIEICILLFTM
jgi:hypothetical protein